MKQDQLKEWLISPEILPRPENSGLQAASRLLRES
jgi:hypothetical protein